MKTTRRIGCLLLAFVMLLSMGALTAFAQGASKAASGKTYQTVTLIGDSLMTGYMIQKSDGTYVDHTHGKRIKASWPSRVADAVGATTYNNYAREGSGTNEILRLLDKNYVPDDYFTDVSNAIIRKYFDGPEAFAKYQKQVQVDLKHSDLILLNAGSNDLFATVMTVIRKLMENDPTALSGPGVRTTLAELDKTVQKLVGEGEVQKAWATVYSVLATAGLAADVVSAMTECAARGYLNFQKNWPKVAKKIHAINPDAKVVVIGLFNGARGMLALPGTDIGLGAAMDPLFNGMNANIISTNALSHYYEYIDITGVEHAAWPSALELLDMNKLYGYMMLCTHPTKAGHKWIARKALNVI